MIVEIVREFQGEYRFLSNFWPSSVEYQGFIYQNNEAAYQAQKTLDLKERKQFLTLDARGAKRLGRKIKLRRDWEEVKEKIMYEICRNKFTQNSELKVQLLNTGNAELQEGNYWHDYEWGICNGKGKNKLGKILMRIREELK